MVTAAPPCVRAGRSERERWELDRRVYALRDRGLSYSDIAAVLDLYEGLPHLSDFQVANWCHKMGEPKNPNKVRAHLPGRAA